ncbi:hypothetical protein MBRA_57020 (plasmid) [Mycobacterium branderi]|uniref:AMP-dependent synthetase n=1 Tax=Mycobacterium branderi TaxID=43348 RepID=A0ABN6BG73_9MYCO|nr:hypothetical protein MBRA_57020 [Mycobacterium branderi]
MSPTTKTVATPPEIEPVSTFPKLLAQTVAARAEHDALVAADETLSYRELDQRCAKMARALLAIGAGKGTRIALLAPDTALWLTTFYAALRIGALVTPISTLTTPSELAQILRTSDAQIVIGARRFLNHDYGEKLTAALPGVCDGTAGTLRVAGAPYLRSVWLDDVAGLPWARSVDDLLSRADGPDAPDDALLAALEHEVVPGDDAFVVYTSGSTAVPKAVMHGQWAVARQPATLATYFGLKSTDRTLCLLPAFWMGGIMTALQVLSTGGTLVYPAGPDIDTVLDTIGRCNVTNIVVWHVSTKLRAAAAARGVDLDGIRVTGAPSRDEHDEIIPPHLQANLLGMSESFGPHSAEPINHRLPESKAGASGRAVNGIERRVVDPQTGAQVAVDEVGELQLRGGALMTGFYKMDRRTVFTPDGFYPTGDLVRLDADGYAYFVGRTGDMIKTNSANVSRLEVEAALNALPDVELSLVAGLPDPERGEIVAAAVIPANGSAPTESDLKEALRQTLSSFKVPRRIVFVSHDDVPRTATGKVRLFELAEFIASRIDMTPNRATLKQPEIDRGAQQLPENRSRPPADEIVRYQKNPKTKIATITLDRADELNGMTIDAEHRFADLVHRAGIDDDVKVLVIRANGPNLGSGADLTELLDIMAGRGDVTMNHTVRVPDDADVRYPPKGSYRHRASHVQFYTDPRAGMRSLQDFKKISILEVRGYCYGWHFYQAADADIVIASDDSLFGHAAWRYAGFAARQWQWCTMMGLRKFMEMVFTGRPFTAQEMYECNFVNAVVPFNELETTTEKYALACARTRPTDTVFAQKTFFEIFKQHQGEYMGSILTGMLESTLDQLQPDPDSFELDDKTRDRGLTNAVRDNDAQFPPEWRLSRRGRASE